ncbi:MAG: hypothetical protein IJK89_07420 [Clostridia bacterium]|nr:hypothetical protein [Clostridia bacterium]
MDTAAKKRKNEYLLPDVAAIAVGVVLFAFCLHLSRKGIQTVDESFYYTIPYRLLAGDRLFIDEWHVSQLSSLFQLVPMKLYLLLAGSADGVILFFRQFYCVVKAAVYCYLYVKLRRYRFAAVAAAGSYMLFEYFTFEALNYYNAAIIFSVIFCSILFLTERPGMLRLAAAGFIFACAVLSEPALAVLYFLWSISVAVVRFRQKKGKVSSYGFITDVRIWFFVSIGILVCFVIFAVSFVLVTDFNAFFRNLPQMFTDSEYDFHSDGGSPIFDPARLLLGFMVTGPVLSAAALCVLAFVLIKKRFGGICPYTGAVLIFAAYIAVTAAFWINAPSCNYISLTVLVPVFPVFLAFGCAALDPGYDKRLLAFLFYALFYSVVVDISSEASITSGFAIGLPCAVILISEFAKNLRSGLPSGAKPKKNGEKLRKTAFAFAVSALCVTLISDGAYAAFRENWFFVEDYYTAEDAEHVGTDTGASLDVKISDGPHKGVYTTAYHAGIYSDILDDLDYIRAVCTGPVYVAGSCSWYYLRLGLPYSTYSTFFVDADMIERNRDWWLLHPDKLPEAVFVSKVDCESYGVFEKEAHDRLTKLLVLFDGEAEELTTGYLLKVKEKRF